MPFGHSAGMVERMVLLLRSRRSREVKACQEAGRVPESWFLLKSITWMAFRALQAAGRLLLKLQTKREEKTCSGHQRLWINMHRQTKKKPNKNTHGTLAHLTATKYLSHTTAHLLPPRESVCSPETKYMLAGSVPCRP